MHFSTTIFVIVLGLGVIQIAVGVVFGRCLPIRQPAVSSRPAPDAGALQHFGRRLFELVNRVSGDVDRHRAEIRQAHHDLAANVPTDSPEVARLVLDSVTRIVEINERLQSRLSAAEEKLQEQTRQVASHLAEARTDPLTGLPNRRAFDDEMTRQIAQWRRKRVTFCLMLIDIDRFKALNDQHGHPAGDHVLRGVADVLRRTFREMDLVSRIGGEEFAAVLPSTDLHDGQVAVERVRAGVATEVFSYQPEELRVTISVGLARVERWDDPVSLVKRADEALYAAKHGGRNCGFYHDGQKCRPIQTVKQTETVEDSGGAAPLPDGSPDDADTPDEMSAICDDLRDSLSRMMSGAS